MAYYIHQKQNAHKQFLERRHIMRLVTTVLIVMLTVCYATPTLASDILDGWSKNEFDRKMKTIDSSIQPPLQLAQPGEAGYIE
jgi:hypothetical protein